MGLILLTLLFSQQPTGVSQEVMVMTGEVNRIDRAGRTVTVMSAGTVYAPIYAGPDLPIFDQLQSGDTVTVRFYDSYVAEITPGAKMTPVTDTTKAAQLAFDDHDSRVLQQTRLVVTIDRIEPAMSLVTYHGADNRSVLRQVMRPQLMDGVKVGDVVTLTFTRAQAVSIEKAK